MSLSNDRIPARYNRQAQRRTWHALERAEWQGVQVCQAQEQAEADWWYYYDDMLAIERMEAEDVRWWREEDEYCDCWDRRERWEAGCPHCGSKQAQVDYCWEIHDEFDLPGLAHDPLTYCKWDQEDYCWGTRAEPRYPDESVAWAWYADHKQAEADKVALDVEL